MCVKARAACDPACDPAFDPAFDLVFDLAFDLDLDLDLPPLSGGRVEVLRSGSTGMDAGRAAIGPWMARRSVPTERDRSEG